MLFCHFSSLHHSRLTRALRSCNNRATRHLSSSTPLAKQALLPLTGARTRFAPSPTGYLHLGSIRTALYNYLLAKKTGGQFLLRIENTDQKRTVSDAEDRLCKDLRWAGLQWDEGPTVGGPYGPYRQSERTHYYREHAEKLLSSNHAYRCFCTVDRLERLASRRKVLGLPTDYDRQCVTISAVESEERAANGEAHVIRLKAPDAYPEFCDLVYGMIARSAGGFTAGITHKLGEIAYEDPVLLKSDGRPTYHLANVVDDHLMEITHVVRATEWISSTPKHLALYDAFGWKAPEFAHVGLLVDDAGRKLSKRNLDTEVAAFRNQGFLPEAVLNFAALLGWSHSRRSDVMDLQQLKDEFQMRFTRGNATVETAKLYFLQRAHVERAAKEYLVGRKEKAIPTIQSIVEALVVELPNLLTGEQAPQLSTWNITPETSPELRIYIQNLVLHDARNYNNACAFLQRNRFFFIDPPDHTVSAGQLLSSAASESLNRLDSIRAYIEQNLEPESASIIRPLQTLYLLQAITRLLFVRLGRQILERNDGLWQNPSVIERAMKSFARSWPDIQLDRTEDHFLSLDLCDYCLENNSSEAMPRLQTQSEKARYSAFCKYIRWMLLDGEDGPGVAATIAILGQKTCERRRTRVDDYLKALLEKHGLSSKDQSLGFREVAV